MGTWRRVAALAAALAMVALAQGAEPRLLGPHGEDILALAFSPDGALLASGANDGTVKVWGVETGEELWVLEGHTRSVVSVAWNPEGTVLASGSDDGTVRLWDPATGAEIQALDLTPPPYTVRETDPRTGEIHIREVPAPTWVREVVWNPDGSLLAISWYENYGGFAVTLWNPGVGEKRRTIPGARGLSWRPDGAVYATVEKDDVTLWDATSEEAIRTLEAKSFAVWSPDGKELLTNTGSGWALWDVDTGRQLQTLGWYGSSRPALSSDGRFLADAYKGNYDFDVPVAGGAVIIDLVTGATLARKSVPYPGSFCVAFSPKGLTVAYGCCGDWKYPEKWFVPYCVKGMIALWDFRDLAASVIDLVAVFDGQRGEVSWVGFTPDGGSIVSTSSRSRITVWDASTRRLLVDCLSGHGQGIFAAALSPDGTFLATTGVFWDKTVRVWELATGACAATLHAPWDVKSVAWSPDGTRIAFGSIDGTIRFAETGTWTEAGLLSERGGVALDLAFDPSGRILAAALGSGIVTVWNLDRQVTIATLRGHTGPVGWVAFSPDGSVLASASEKEVKLWAASTWEEVGMLARGVSGPLAFHPERRLLALATGAGKAEVWSLETFERLAVVGLGGVRSVAFSPDGLFLVTGHADASVLLWEVAALLAK